MSEHANRRVRHLRTGPVLALLTLVLPPAHAHLMVAQRGTLNVVGSGAFVVLSLPVSAFHGVDDDGDGGLSMIEFEAHRDELTTAVTRDVRLLDGEDRCPLQGIMLAPSLPETDPSGSAEHLIVMGRFALTEPADALRLEIDLFGTEAAERTLEVTATRRATDQRQRLVLTPEAPARALFPSS